MRRAAFIFTAALAFLFLFGLVFATLGELPTAVSSLCAALTSLLPIVGMLMILVAAVVYATGQVMGAETRARGNVWATACIGGALMAFLIVAVAPPVLQALFPGGAISCTVGATTCGSSTCAPTESCIAGACCPSASVCGSSCGCGKHEWCCTSSMGGTSCIPDTAFCI